MNAASVGHQCPECVAEGRKTQRPVRTAFGGSTAGARGFVTISLIAINSVMLIVSIVSSKRPGQAVAGGGLGGLLGGGTPLSGKLAVIGKVGCYQIINGVQGPHMACATGIANGQYYRLLTAMFVHYGLLHLAMNMYALWIFGRPLEAMFGPVRFLAVYLVCGLGGNVAVYLLAPDQPSAGASTAIFGLFAVFFFVLRRLNRSVAGLVPLLLINLVFSLVPGISLWGHLGGLATGAIVGYGVTHAPQERRTQIQAGIIVAAVVLLGLATAWQTHHLTSTLTSIDT
jgi:membrane associated rhomboid family serine protease